MRVVPRHRSQPLGAASSRGAERSGAGAAAAHAPAGFFLNPAAIVVVLLSIFPFVLSLGMTFTNWNLLYPGVAFRGLDNWARLFGDATFQRSVANTIFFTVAATA